MKVWIWIWLWIWFSPKKTKGHDPTGSGFLQKKKQKPMIAWIGGPRDERLTLDLVFSKKTKGHA